MRVKEKNRASEQNAVGATKLLVQIFWAIVSDRAENLGEGSEAQVSKVDREIFEKNCFCLITYRW